MKGQTATHLPVDGKYGANGGQAVDVGRSIQGVKADHVLPLDAQREEPLRVNTVHASGCAGR